MEQPKFDLEKTKKTKKIRKDWGVVLRAWRQGIKDRGPGSR